MPHMVVDGIAIADTSYAVLCVDVLVFNKQGKILVGKKVQEPFRGKWMLPGGLVDVHDDNVEAAVLRGVKQEYDLDIKITHLVDVYGDPDSKHPADPRFYGVQVVYAAQCANDSDITIHTELFSEYKWIDPHRLWFTQLAFNHKYLIGRFLSIQAENRLISSARTLYTENFGKSYHYNDSEHMHIVVMGIVLNERNEILLGHRVQEPFKGHWDFPGGHMYVHESIEECLKREVYEELGVSCDVGTLFHVYSDRGMSPRFARAMVLYVTHIHSQKFVKNIELDDFKYFPLDQLPEQVAYHCEGALADIRKYVESR